MLYASPRKGIIAALVIALAMYRTATSADPKVLELPERYTTRIAFSPNGKLIAIGRRGPGKENLYIVSWPEFRHIKSIKAHRRSVEYLAFSPDSKVIATAGDSSQLLFWSTESFEQVGSVKGDSGHKGVRNRVLPQELQKTVPDTFDSPKALS